MAWPLSRATTYVNGSVLPANDLNLIQDGTNRIYNGTVSLKGVVVDGTGGDAVSAVPGQLLVKQTSNATTPLAIMQDEAGNNRLIVDHNGYPMGHDIEFKEFWQYPLLDINSTQLAFGAGSAWGFVSGNTNYHFKTNYDANLFHSGYGEITLGSVTAADLAEIYSTFYVLTSFQSVTAVLEFDLLLSGTSYSTDYEFRVGLKATTAYDNDDGIFFKKKSTSSTWFAVTQANPGSVTETPTTVSGQSGAIQRMRIEFYGGSFTSYPASARFFIDGNLVATNTTNISPLDMFIIFQARAANTNTASNSIRVGPVMLAYNHYVSNQVL